MSNVMKWLDTLNWSKIPEFKSIHDLPNDRFLGCYYKTETVNQFRNDLVAGLKYGYGFIHKTIVGDKGSGKTTFLYYLKADLAALGSDSNWHLEIIHIQRLISKVNEETVIAERVVKMFSSYFSINGKQKEFEEISNGSKEIKVVVNNLKDHVLMNKSLFSRRLIIAIDDVDETPAVDTERALRYLYSLVECEYIPRWLAARSTTLNNYRAEFIDFIETKFQQRSVFPKVDLFGIMATRIEHDNPKGDNPFSAEICRLMLSANNSDLRVAIANALPFLEQLEPPMTSKGNSKFTQQFFLKNFTKVMTAIGVFPNIYAHSLSNTVPIEKDVFLILAIKNDFKSGYLRNLEQHYRNVYANIHSKRYAEESYLINISMDLVTESIYFLTNNRLISPHPRIKNFYRLTSKGEAFIRFLHERLYTQTAKEMNASDGSSESKHPVFWDLAAMQPDYESDAISAE